MEPNPYEAPMAPPEPTTVANPVSLKPLLLWAVVAAVALLAVLCVIPALVMQI